jgi:hypothetical protein
MDSSERDKFWSIVEEHFKKKLTKTPKLELLDFTSLLASCKPSAFQDSLVKDDMEYNYHDPEVNRIMKEVESLELDFGPNFKPDVTDPSLLAALAEVDPMDLHYDCKDNGLDYSDRAINRSRYAPKTIPLSKFFNNSTFYYHGHPEDFHYLRWSPSEGQTQADNPNILPNMPVEVLKFIFSFMDPITSVCLGVTW